MSQITVTDTRPDGDPSLGVVPRLSDFETLQSIFHLAVDRSLGWDEAPLGQACWKLAGFELRAGPAEYKLRVLKADGQPFPNIVAYRHRPGAPQLPGTVRPPYFNHGQGQFTNQVGEVVFGEASVAGPNGGSDTIWVSASPPGMEPQFSDAVNNLGRHSVTGLVPNPIFQYAVQDGADLPQADEHYSLAIMAGGQEVGRLVFGQVATTDHYVVLRRGSTELGRLPWQPAS
jgi:hypothetical protein